MTFFVRQIGIFKRFIASAFERIKNDFTSEYIIRISINNKIDILGCNCAFVNLFQYVSIIIEAIETNRPS